LQEKATIPASPHNTASDRSVADASPKRSPTGAACAHNSIGIKHATATNAGPMKEVKLCCLNFTTTL
jgi:hypothetical protein